MAVWCEDENATKLTVGEAAVPVTALNRDVEHQDGRGVRPADGQELLVELD
jgi:hypothetical protein